MERQKIKIKTHPDLFIKIKYPEIISGPKNSFTLKENYVGSAVSEILRYRQKKSLLLYIIEYIL